MFALEVDGAYGEGGGQLVRTAVALAAVTGRSISIRNIRARRRPPGLAPQHAAAVRAVAALCRAKTTGVEPKSVSLQFEPRALRDGRYRVDIGTAGSIPLVLQAMLPVMLATRRPISATITGGTDIYRAPAADYLAHVLLPLITRIGARVELKIVTRGYYPAGGGEMHVSVEPSVLRVQAFDAPGRVTSIGGVAHVARLPLDIALRMRESAALALAARLPLDAAHIEACVAPEDSAAGPGGAIALWAQTEASVLGTSQVARRGVRAETLGAAAGEALGLDLASRAGVDIHASDQLPVYFGLAGGGSYTTRMLTPHAQTAIWLIEQFVPLRFVVARIGGLTHVSAVPTPG